MNILITSAGTRGYLIKYFKKALKEKGKIFAADCSKYAPALYNADNYFIVPPASDKNYIDELTLGKSNKSFYWAGLMLNNLEESIIDFYKRGELATIKNFNSKVIEFVEPYLEKSKDLNKKTGMDKFL